MRRVEYRKADAEGKNVIKGKWRQDLIQSSDGNFRPCDLELGPDGALYFIDWHDTLIGHMQHSARDPLRNSTYCRIYRITATGRDLVDPPKINGADLATLFENTKLPEINARKWSHRELRKRDAKEVIAAAHEFASKNADDERLVLEALWATWGQQQPSPILLAECLKAEDHRVRCGALRVVRHSLDILDDPAQYLITTAVEENPHPRLEALAAATWLGREDGAKILLTVVNQPTDQWIRMALNSSILKLKSDVDALLAAGKFKDTPDLDKLLASKLLGAAIRKEVITKAAKAKRKVAKAKSSKLIISWVKKYFTARRAA